MVDSAITCDEIIESYDEETKTIPINFNGKNATCKRQKLYILFYLYHYSIYDIWYYLLLSDKISRKMKIFINISIHK